MTEQRFVDNGDGTVTDTWTKLMWLQEDSFLMLKKSELIQAGYGIISQSKKAVEVT